MLPANEITPIENLCLEADLKNQKEVTDMLNNELFLSEKQMPMSLVFVI